MWIQLYGHFGGCSLWQCCAELHYIEVFFLAFVPISIHGGRILGNTF